MAETGGFILRSVASSSKAKHAITINVTVRLWAVILYYDPLEIHYFSSWLNQSAISGPSKCGAVWDQHIWILIALCPEAFISWIRLLEFFHLAVPHFYMRTAPRVICESEAKIRSTAFYLVFHPELTSPWNCFSSRKPQRSQVILAHPYFLLIDMHLNENKEIFTLVWELQERGDRSDRELKSCALGWHTD